MEVLAADARNIIPLLLWPAVAVSLGVYAYRGYRRWFVSDRSTAETESSLPDVAGATPPGETPRTASPSGPPAMAPPSVTADPISRAKPGPLVSAVIREEIEARRAEAASSAFGPGDAAPARAGLFATARPDPDTTPEQARPPVAEALAGIRLPDSLTPLVGTEPIDARCVRFAARAVDPAALGAELGDELERLGYALHSIDETTAEARRDGVVLRVALVPRADLERDELGARRFPTVGADSTVVEFTT